MKFVKNDFRILREEIENPNSGRRKMASTPVSVQINKIDNNGNYRVTERQKTKPFGTYFYFMAKRKEMEKSRYGVYPELIITSLHQEWLKMPIDEKKEWIKRANQESALSESVPK